MALNLRYELKLLKRYASVAGADEAGRGAWAGPIVAGAVLIKAEIPRMPKDVKNLIKDSKLLTPKSREKVFKFITKNFDWAVGVVGHAEIDKIGIQAANFLAMKQAVLRLQVAPQFLLVDGRGFKFEIEHQNIIDGDFRIFCIAAASIVAKVTRDRILIEASQKFPEYHFEKNKGYGTLSHFQAISQNGLCELHRRSFQPMKNMI